MKALEDVFADADRCRGRRGELQAKRAEIERAPVSVQGATDRIDAFLAELASAPGEMTHRFTRSWASSNDFAATTLGLVDGPGRGISPRDVVRALAFLNREGLRAALVADAAAAIEAAGGGLSEDDRSEALAAIDSELLALEVREELAIRESEAAGYEGLDRRGDAEPAVVLARDPAALLAKAA